MVDLADITGLPLDAIGLGGKLGPVLLQLPPSLRAGYAADHAAVPDALVHPDELAQREIARRLLPLMPAEDRRAIIAAGGIGSEGMGLRAKGLSVNLCIAAWPWPDYMDADSRERGIKVRTSSFTRHHVNITMCKGDPFAIRA